MKLKFNLAAPKDAVCAACRQPLGDRYMAVVRAGSAWHDGMAEIVEGAEMFRVAYYHERCAPPQEDE